MPDQEYEIRLLEAGDRVTGLSLGDEAFVPLKTFLQNHAKQYQRKSLARTYMAFIDSGRRQPKPVGYISIVCGEIVTDDTDLLDDEELRYDYAWCPAVKIARLAVDVRHRKNGLGRELVRLAVGRVKELIAPTAGCRFIVVDAKSQSVSFYRKIGFTPIDTDANRARDELVMFMDLSKIDA